MTWFEGKRALVTGGGSGIGAAVATILRDKGAQVTILGRNADRLASAAARMGVESVQADVTDRDSIASAVGQIATVDILVNNAGVAEAMPFAKMTDEHWDRMLAVNLTGVYNCSKAVIGGMLDSGGGRIVNVASIAGLRGAAYIAGYCAAKHGVIGLTRALASEYAAKNITVNAICPGYVDTDIVSDAVESIADKTGRSKEEALAELVKNNPQGRLIRPEEVADAVAWVCRQESVNGQSIAIDGGEVT